MLHQPFFWLFFPFQFVIFVFLANRIAFHPRKIVSESLWVWGGVLILFGMVASLFFLLACSWDFGWDSFPSLAIGWKIYVLGSVAWVFFMAVNHMEWHWFRMKPVDYRMISQKFPNHPPRFKVPLAFLEKISIENQLYDLEVVQYDVYLAHWPKVFSGLSIVQLSDIHFGKFIHKDYLRMVFDEAKKLKPDLFALTGDFVSHPKDIAPMKGLLKGFKAPLGVYGLLGNHDHWAGGEAVKKALEADGIKVLQNDVVYLKRKGKTLALLGVDDLWEGKKDVSALLEAKGDAKVLLAHQPDHFYLGKKLKVNLQISGHCHGGHICFPIIGPLIVPTVQGRKFASGFMREKDVTLFIHRGIGGFPPLRTLCRPQVVKLVLKSAS